MMRSFRRIFLLTIALGAAPAQAAEMRYTLPKMSACQHNEECVIAEGICGSWVGVNSSLKAEYDSVLTRLRPAVSCPQLPEMPQPAAAACVNRKCIVK